MEPTETPIKKCLYVDLSNLFGGMSELLKPGEYFDFSTLLPVIDTEFGGIDEFKVYGAYMGLSAATSPSNQLFVKAQNEFFNSAKLQGVHFGQGRISRHGQEKGVDMQLGVDMVNDAHLGKFTDVVLLSEDADFTYPVSIVKAMNINFHYCGFATRYSNNLAWQAWRKVLLDCNGYFAANILPALNSPKNLKLYDLDKDSSVIIKKA